MAKSSNFTDDVLRFFKWLFILLMIVVIVITSLWVFIYSLYRIAIFSRLLYSYVFITVLAGVLLFFFVKSIKQKKFSRIVLKFTKFLLTAIMVLLIMASFMMYGAFFLRYPLIGIIISPGLVFIIVLAASKWKPFHFFKKIFHNF